MPILCCTFGREAKVGSKRKASSPGSGQSWTVPFRYDNIENHVYIQHPLKWAEYEKAKMIWKYTSRYDECNKFFSHTNSIAASARSHFQSPDWPGQGRQQLVFTIDKSIVEVIIGEMMFASTDEDIPTTSVGDGDDDDASVVIDNDDDGGINIASSRFCTSAEQDAVMNDRRVLAARAKALALSLFERIDTSAVGNVDDSPAESGNDEEDASTSYSYVATITKPLLFELAVRYISCGATFRMAENIMRHTTEVFEIPSRTLARKEVGRMMRVASAANLQKISLLLNDAWAFSIAIDSATHHSTSYLDLRFRIYSKKHRNIFNLHGCAIPMRDRHTGEVMFDMLVKFLRVLCPKWKVSMLGIASDGARNMTGRATGVVTSKAAKLYAQQNVPF